MSLLHTGNLLRFRRSTAAGGWLTLGGLVLFVARLTLPDTVNYAFHLFQAASKSIKYTQASFYMVSGGAAEHVTAMRDNRLELPTGQIYQSLPINSA